MTGPVTAYRRVRPADFYLYDGTPECAQAIVDWAHGHAYITQVNLYDDDGKVVGQEDQLLVMTLKRGDLVVEPGDRVTSGIVPGDWYPIDPDAYHAGWREHS